MIAIYFIGGNIKISSLLSTLKLNLNHSIIIFIGLVAISANIIFHNYDFVMAQDNWNYSSVNADDVTQLVEEISQYTFFEEDITDVKSTLVAMENKDFINKEDSIITEESKLETEYMVQKGDNITTIADKFNIHVASIVDRNSLSVSDIEKIKSGQKLIIPAKDTSNSKDWLTQLNQKKQAEVEAAKKIADAKSAQAKINKLVLTKRSTTYRERSSGAYDGIADGSWGNPTSYSYISRGISAGHAGIDMVTSIGTPVYAAKSGKVVEITGSWGGGYGNSILLDHGASQSSRYAHLSSIVVGTGEVVNKGQLIGYSGNTGNSTGPHLHFEVRQSGIPVNPF